MKNQRKHAFIAVLSLVVLALCGALILNQKASAAGEGKITGTVKLNGTAPHMKGIDMSKDPYCAKAHASDETRSKQHIHDHEHSPAHAIAVGALRYFLLAPNRLALRDVTIANWTRIDAVGTAWEKGEPAGDERHPVTALPDGSLPAV